jgi:hypothetical protein
MHHHQLTRKLQDKDGWIYRGRHDDTSKHHLWHTGILYTLLLVL